MSAPQTHLKKKTGPYTVIRLAYTATFERACELATIDPAEVNLTQSVGEKLPDLREDFRIISFDGIQMTISERINGERRTRGFEVSSSPGARPRRPR